MNRVAITGLGVISPVGQDIETVYANLRDGVCGVGRITRFDPSETKISVAAEVKDFDPEAFGISRGDTRRMDLFTQYAMAAAQQAVDDSGIVGARRPGTPRRLRGQRHRRHEHLHGRVQKTLRPRPQPHLALVHPHDDRQHCRGQHRHPLWLQGAEPARGHGLRHLHQHHRRGLPRHPLRLCRRHPRRRQRGDRQPAGHRRLCQLQGADRATDPEAASLPFDRRRAGFVLGEGAAVVVLENYDHAVARGAHIYAEMCGYGNTCDAHHITAPDPEAEGGARAIRLAYEEAGSPEGLLYINAHGTGTPLNDSSETLAIKKALGEEKARAAMVSSTKSMTGHMLGAAGAFECVACALALARGTIFPTIHLQEPDPACDLDYVPGQARAAQAEAAISVSLGFGGHNAAIALRRCV